MNKKVSLVAGVATALLIGTLAVSCDDSTGPDGDDYIATLIAANEVSPPSTSTGSGVITFEDEGTHFEYTLSVTGLSSITAAHIHGPAAAGANAGIIINLFIPVAVNPGTTNGVLATGTITDAHNPNFSVATLRTMFNSGTAYVNVHTSQFPTGAIRGQVVAD